jgi:hypothetical protein
MLLGRTQRGKQEAKKNKTEKKKSRRKNKNKEKEKKPNLGDAVSTPRDGVETSVGAMLWCRPAEDVELRWSRVAASANGT